MYVDSTMTAYLGLLGALSLWTLAKEEPMRRTVWTLIAVAIAAYGFTWITNSTGADYSLFMLAVNGAACWNITRQPAAGWQSVVGMSFVLQIATDVTTIARESFFGPIDMNYPALVTTVLAFVQLLCVAGWGVHDRVRRHYRRFGPNPVAYSAYPSGRA